MVDFTLPEKILIDARNIDQYEAIITEQINTSPLVGFDLETQDVNAHQGIKTMRKENEEGDKTGDKVVFDWRRMTVTGISLYPSNCNTAYYINLTHADVVNRVEWPRIKKILEAKGENTSFICHKAPFELTVMRNSLDFTLRDVICTLQMAVSAYGPDEYNIHNYAFHNLGDIPTLFEQARDLFATQAPGTIPDDDLDPDEVKSKKLNPRQQDLLSKVIGKTSVATYSYNGFNRQISYGYDLKKAVKTWFGYQMETYEECLRGRRHMGELTGEEVVSYGADDAFWAVQLFYALYAFMEHHCPDAIQTFFEQENPMIYVYSDILREGMLVNKQAIEARRATERKAFADTVRDMKATIRKLLPFRPELDAKLVKYEKWYGVNPDAKKVKAPGGTAQRKIIEDWANSPDSPDDYVQACQVSSPVSNAWKGSKNSGLSIGHYYKTRVLMYDLCQIPAIIYKGKVSSDSECRGEIRDIIKKLKGEQPDREDFFEAADHLIELMGSLASIEQRMKLYITPYMLLTDPETGRMYPEVSSMLATRRMASSNPNPMQLSKRGESTYIRGFYLPDADDEVQISLDWSQIELVLIGEASGDPGFANAFGQLPYNDMHLGAAADVLSVVIPEVNEDMMKNMHKMTAAELPPKLLIKPNGEPLDPAKAKKFWRTEVGKGSNFNYWYSGALSTVGEKMGWTSDQMWKATERYRERFPVAEKWRVDTIEKARWAGFVQLPDGHRRYRYEATYEWQNITRRLFQAYQDPGVSRFGDEIIRAIKTRAGNQIVNAMIQGACATLAKRSILSINKRIAEEGIRARFKMPIHDELVFSVYWRDAVRFIKMAKEIMKNHPQIISNLKIDATASIGLTFEPFNEKTAPFGQIELDEAPAILGFGDGVKLNDEQIEATIQFLYNQRKKVA